MKFAALVVFAFVAINGIVADLNDANQEGPQHNAKLPSNGVAVDEVVVESSLYIKPKQQRTQLRRIRRSILSNFNIFKSLAEHRRVKRQFDQHARSATISYVVTHPNQNNLQGFGKSIINALKTNVI